MKRIKITQTKSIIGQTKSKKKIMEALGLRKIRQTKEHNLTPAIKGMISKVDHLIEIEELS